MREHSDLCSGLGLHWQPVALVLAIAKLAGNQERLLATCSCLVDAAKIGVERDQVSEQDALPTPNAAWARAAAAPCSFGIAQTAAARSIPALKGPCRLSAAQAPSSAPAAACALPAAMLRRHAATRLFRSAQRFSMARRGPNAPNHSPCLRRAASRASAPLPR